MRAEAAYKNGVHYTYYKICNHAEEKPECMSLVTSWLRDDPGHDCALADSPSMIREQCRVKHLLLLQFKMNWCTSRSDH